MHKEEERERKALMTPPSTDCSADDCPLAAGAVVQRKQRSKRRRHPSPSPPTASSASSSESTTTEEEDMAHCLILLAQGGGRAHAAVDSPPSQPAPAPAQPKQQPPIPAASTVKTERYTSRKYTEAAATADGAKAGFYVYECKTCNKCFPSFQALGGHRASHKKPRVTTAAEENMTTTAANAKKPSPSPPPPSPDTTAVITLSLTTGAGVGGSNNKLARVHECSICGAEFASGQALGGHMRRHRPLNAPEGVVTAVPTAAVEEKRERSINLELDLNMPAPSDEAAPEPAPTTFGQFDGKKGALMLTASALVDCHY